MNVQNKLPTIGFVGTGTITTAIVTAFCERVKKVPYPIVLSPRSKSNAEKLKAAYPERVRVAESMQEVLDRSQYVVLAVLPEVGEMVCRSLRFRPDHRVINFMCDKTLPQICSWIGKTEILVHMVPSTFNEICNGPIVLCPPQKDVEEIFGHIGTIIPVEERHHAGVLTSITACMLSFFTLQDKLVQWAKAEGVSGDFAAKFTTNYFLAMSTQASLVDEAQLHTLATVTTPGGVNYLVKDTIASKDGFGLWMSPMPTVLKRLAPKE